MPSAEQQVSTRQAEVLTVAVIYAAKSTQDERGSIPTQLADGRELAAREGLEVVGEFSDEAASAYKGDRGPDLAAALAECERLAGEHDEVALIVQHSDRLARGDGRKAKHLVEYALWAIKTGVTIRSVHDPQTFGDLLYAVVTGQRNHEDSMRKGQATAAGHRRRWGSRKRLGSPIPDGYRLEPVLGDDGRPLVARDGRAIREPQLDPDRAPLWARIFDLIEAGHTCGDVRATLNGEGIRKQRGGAWRTRDIRRGVLNDWYCGRAHAYGETIVDDHPALIEPARWERIAALVQTDERASKGGRPPLTDGADYLLRGLATCWACGAPMWTRRLAAGRMYVCSSKRQSTGCDAPYIPAERLERAVLDHLDGFLANVEGWLRDQTAHANAERDKFAELIESQRSELRKLETRAARAHDLADKLLDQEDDIGAAAALKKAAVVEDEVASRAHDLAQAEEHLAEWPQPDVDQALDVYTELQEAISGRVTGSKGIQELRATLRSVLSVVLLDYRNGDLLAWFGLRVAPEHITGYTCRGALLIGEDGVAVGEGGEDARRVFDAYPGIPIVGGVGRIQQYHREVPATTC